MSWFELGDVDAGYHIAYGRQFLATGQIVDRDPFIYLENAKSFVNANWGSQIIMALAERVAGVHGLIFLRSLLLIIIFTSIAYIAWTVSKSSHAIAWAWILAAVAGYERFSMRPELFSYAIMTIQLAILVRARMTRAGIFGLISLQMLWVNLHSYFLVGVLMSLAALIAGFVLDWLKGVMPSASAHKLRLRLLTIVLIGQILVCFINPWHWRGAVFPLGTLKYLQQEEVIAGSDQQTPRNAWGEISEFRSPFRFVNERVNKRTIHAYFVLLGVAFLGCIALVAIGRPDGVLIILLLALMSFQMRRNIAQFAFIAAPLSIGAILALAAAKAEAIRSLARITSLAAAALLSGYWVQSVYTGYFYFSEQRITREFGADYSDATHHRRALEFLSNQPGLKPNLFVDYFTSSNSLLWLPDRFKIFVDTNTFAYPEPILRAAFDVGLGKIPHEKFFQDHGVNIGLLHAGPDTQLLIRNLAADTANWALVYVDPYAVIFLRRIPEHEPIILANTPTQEQADVNAWVASARGGRYHQAQSICLMANVPISLGWYRCVAALIEQVLRRTDEYPQAWYLSALAHANLGKAAGRKRDYSELKIQYTTAREFAARVIKLEPDNAAARQIYDDMQKQLSLLGGM